MEGRMGEFSGCFSGVPDPRAANARHDLSELLFVALAAVLCGAESCADMAEFGKAKEDLLRQVLRLEHGIPSHDTFSRVFRLLDPDAFEAVFRRFMAGFAKALHGVVAIDGKAVRGAFERGRRTTPLHLVNVWAAEQRLVLAQRTAPNRNEVAGALEAVELLSLAGCTVTADALHCHTRMAQAILERGGAYVLALKQNQSALYADALALFNAYPNVAVLRTFSKAYGLAGLRVGYAIAPEHVATALRKAATPFGVSDIAQQAAIASLEAFDELELRVKALIRERARVVEALRAQGWTVPQTEANFVWLPLGEHTLSFADYCRGAGLIVRSFDGEGARCTIGETEANDLFIRVAGEYAASHLASTGPVT